MTQPVHNRSMSNALTVATRFIQEADALLITAGAGMGIDSGLPDFRGDNGFWRAYPHLQRAGLSFQEVASPFMFARHPQLAWGFYGHRLHMYRDTQPHAGFGHLLTWGRAKPKGLAVFTSNVDGQFQLAGHDPGTLVECHGSLHHLQCTTLCTDAIWPATDFVPQVDPHTGLLTNPPPTCPHCGALARPNVLMFNDGLWVANRTEAQTRTFYTWLEGVERGTVIELGAGSAISTVRNLGHKLNNRGWRLVRVNPDTPLHTGHLKALLPMGALAFTQALAPALQTPTH